MKLSEDDDGFDSDRFLAMDHVRCCAQYCDLIPGMLTMRDDAFAAAALSRAYDQLEKARVAIKPIVDAIKARNQPKSF